MDEQWLPLPFDDRYTVSSLGQVRGPRKLLKLMSKPHHKYLVVWISGKYHFVHHLVALTFIGDKPDELFVLHRDDNPTNNHVTNLYYGTLSDNANDRVTNGSFKSPTQVLTAIDTHFIQLLHNAGYPRSRLKHMYNVCYSTIYRATS